MKNYIYTLMIHEVNQHCYENCLNYFSRRASILDVGIGNGMMLKNFHPLIKSKDLKITGIDINRYYLNHCQSLIKKYGLEEHIAIHCIPVEAYAPSFMHGFDFILFSMSFMLFRDPDAVLNRVKAWLKPGGQILFFQTIYKDKFRLMEYIKPRLRHITTVDFGMVTYEADFLQTLESHRLRVVKDRLIMKKWFKGEYRMLATNLADSQQSAERCPE